MLTLEQVYRTHKLFYASDYWVSPVDFMDIQHLDTLFEGLKDSFVSSSIAHPSFKTLYELRLLENLHYKLFCIFDSQGAMQRLLKNYSLSDVLARIIYHLKGVVHRGDSMLEITNALQMQFGF